MELVVVRNKRTCSSRFKIDICQCRVIITTEIPTGDQLWETERPKEKPKADNQFSQLTIRQNWLFARHGFQKECSRAGGLRAINAE
jgi:hypothetical protein